MATTKPSNLWDTQSAKVLPYFARTCALSNNANSREDKIMATCSQCGTSKELKQTITHELMCAQCIRKTWHICFVDDSTCAECGGNQIVTVKCDRCLSESITVTRAEWDAVTNGELDDCLTDDADAVFGREHRTGLVAYVRCTAWPDNWHARSLGLS